MRRFRWAKPLELLLLLALAPASVQVWRSIAVKPVPCVGRAGLKRLPFLLKPRKRFVAFKVGDWLCLLHPWGLNVSLFAAGQQLFEAEGGRKS